MRLELLGQAFRHLPLVVLLERVARMLPKLSIEHCWTFRLNFGAGTELKRLPLPNVCATFGELLLVVRRTARAREQQTHGIYFH